MFPYAAIEKNSRVVIYGAGQVGRTIVDSLKESGYCDIVLWVDRFFDNERIMSPNRLLNMSIEEYDYIVLATTTPIFAEEIKWNLRDMGIPKERLICMAT